MIIESLAASFPSRKVSNADVVELIGQHSQGFDGNLDKGLRIVKTLLDRSGLVNRNWCAEDERPIDHLGKAVSDALDSSGFTPKDVDLFVYVGIGGGFREPANSYMAAKALGFTRAECFDVIDACMSWTRAMSLVDSLFKTRSYRNAMIVNAEFHMQPGGPMFPNYALENTEQLEYALPTFTIGEAATATLLLPDDPGNFNFTFHSKPEYADLCTIPFDGYEGFCADNYHIGRLGPGRFTAMGAKMHQQLEQGLPFVLQGVNADEFDVAFTHTSSQTEWARACEKFGIGDKIYHVYHRTGNVVSASIPAAIALAREAGRLKKGDRVLSCMGSAGLSFNATRFRF
ncbi:3-oxoacyl-[acyl-carrier-protein] synthase III C-terminal domain-containing protein [Ramlibacter sp.]|uniref:3-oxoacyl-[acyl-carrier-protein] synthase III C-terminal domain-containing protein n=1 Tax=Ramlibacter sp. TaxID=1917967 RepID=UPI0017EA5434|nr:3-oxoacyl-[acyl-carrier-protein] synthase III C-terminal domain-containing protein [Ramlibacter sp.]MBA2673455.1 3-oxoacyl-ACP synthase [Ramlibacter sp.]